MNDSFRMPVENYFLMWQQVIEPCIQISHDKHSKFCTSVYPHLNSIQYLQSNVYIFYPHTVSYKWCHTEMTSFTQLRWCYLSLWPGFTCFFTPIHPFSSQFFHQVSPCLCDVTFTCTFPSIPRLNLVPCCTWNFSEWDGSYCPPSSY